MFKKCIALLFLSSLLINCTQTPKRTVATQTKQNHLQYAKHFELIEDSSFTRLHILNPETGEVQFKAILSKTKPNKIQQGYLFIQIPLQKMAILSASQIGMLSKLNAQSSISAVSNEKYIYDSLLLKNIQEKTTRGLGDESSISIEKIAASGSKYIFYSDFGSPFPHKEQLFKMGIVTVPNLDWRELHPLGKAEWIKLFGYLTGKKEHADRIFNETCARYNQLKNIALKEPKSETVLSGNIMGDSWFAPAGGSFYAAQMKDAACTYRYADTKGTGSISKSLEIILQENKSTVFWINPGFPTKKEILRQQPKLKYLEPFNRGKIYCYSHNMNKFWELGAIEPQSVLEDLIRIFHPGLLPDGPFNFYKEVE